MSKVSTKLVSSIAKNYAHLASNAWTDHGAGTADEEARTIADSCLKAMEVVADVEVASEYVNVAERRLESCDGTFSDTVKRWSKEIISDTRAYIFAAETNRR